MELFTVEKIYNVEMFKKLIEEYAKSNGIEKHPEIERKWLFKTMDFSDLPVKKLSHYNTLQCYISIEPEIRLHSIGEIDGNDNFPETYRHFITIKNGSGLVRDEYSFEVSAKTAVAISRYLRMQKISSVNGYYPIKKDFVKYLLPDGEEMVIATVDDDCRFIYGEIEFPTVSVAMTYNLSECLIPYVISEITYEENYKMKNYWKDTRLRIKNGKN